MATRPKAIIETHGGEKFSPITIAKNVLMGDGQNLQDILSDGKEDMMTPIIENSSSMFKVGQGDNVDYSENVVDGVYESCVLKGVTKYIDNVTGEILDSFVENRNLSLIDAKSPILTNIGKNLYNPKTAYIDENNQEYVSNIAFVKPNTEYTFKPGKETRPFILELYNDNNQLSWVSGEIEVSSLYFTTFENEILAKTKLRYERNINIEQIDFIEVQLEEGRMTEYEPYKSNITTFTTEVNKTIVLRGLPNGVRDTLNVKTGEYIQRIGEIILDDEFITDVEMSNINSDYNTLLFTLKNSINVQGQFMNNGLPKDTYDNHLLDKEMLIINNDKILIRLKKDKLENIDIISFINYLDLNPITVQYELVTPIVKQVNVEGYPYAYENGHVLLESGSQEQSLTPTIEYSIVANRGGQIRSNQKMVERHQKQLDRLQAMILTNLVNTQYEQTLTNLKYDLKNVREEVK